MILSDTYTKQMVVSNKKYGPRIIVKTVLLLVLQLLISCKDKGEVAAENNLPQNENQVVLTETQFKNAGIETIKLIEKDMAGILKLNGKIDVPPQNLISVSAPMGGYLLETKLLPGTHVRKGERIAIMEDQQYIQLQQDYLQAKSRFNFAELDYYRQKDLNQSQASSNKVLQLAQAEMNNQRILMKALAEKLKLITINPATLTADKISKNVSVYSPISGFVSKVNANIGKYIAPSDVMFELIDPEDIHLSLRVYEKDVIKLAIGQKIIAYSNAEPDKKYEAQIILISKDINTDGLTTVHCHFTRYDKDLLPGMYMNAEVELTSGKAKTLPEASIVNYEGKDYVFVQTAPRKYMMQEVTIGNKEKSDVAIQNSSTLEGKTIVSNGAYTLLMQLKNKEE
ncbi:efflux RND transporter periplasmic adaptor subunit [Flavobacterium cerinum]|uniref:Efflux RND transporter periplasmic adaptor subunit n=1 Tax=Flavobacterium cerinum TaxID=2502784 RepID=A0ABY5IT62_9FLAO|nr:efflux RND transporter periplasmic adaptor subunit [Flavobacterium cerinum]UUC45984.1 efflux RND transporter periplasmic adaptor subunit [Flavobacterium cerinum]